MHEGNGRHFGVQNVSDGTLRFMAVLTAILGAREHTTCFLDELETGLHPSRIWLLVRLIEEHVGQDELQVIATTHSPEVLDRMNDRTFEDSTVLANIQGHASSSAHRIADLPNAAKLRESHGLGRLLRNGLDGGRVVFRRRRRIGKRGRSRNGRPVNVLIIPEDSTRDQYILRPLFSRLFHDIGKPNARVRVCGEKARWRARGLEG